MSIRTKHADFTLAEADLLVCDAAIATALEKTATLPETETTLVKHLAKIGNKSESFAREAHALGKQHEGLLPRDMDLETLERALRNRDALRERLVAARHLAERLEAAIVLLGVDSYRDGLDIYHALKRGGTTQALREAVKELGRNFRKSPAKPKALATAIADLGNAGAARPAEEEREDGGSVRVQATPKHATRPEPPRVSPTLRGERLAARVTWDAAGGAGLGEAWSGLNFLPGFTWLRAASAPATRDQAPLDHALHPES